MGTPAITLEVLPAGYGDCLLLGCMVGKRAWRMLVDTGPDECYPQLQARLLKLAKDGKGRRRIDLLVVTHIDHDHIGGIAQLLADKTLAIEFGDIWFNAPKAPAERGVAEGQSLAETLGAPATPLPWNRAFGGGHAVTAAQGGCLAVPMPRGAPRITLLSPAPPQLDALFKVWDKELVKLRAKSAARPMPTEVARGVPDIEALAARATPTDRAVANASSIALLLEHRGASVLLGADAVPTVMVPALHTLARDRGQEALTLDAIKLSHHASRANVTAELLRVVHAAHYVVSTNNAIFSHPDDEALARVLVHGGATKSVWFNFATERNRKWAELDLQRRYSYRACYPAELDEGVTLRIGNG